MNALEKYVTKTKLAAALAEKLASPKHVPKIPPKSMATLPPRKKLAPAKPGLTWTGLRTPTKVKVLGGPKSRPLVSRTGGDLVLRKTDKAKTVPVRMMATGH